MGLTKTWTEKLVLICTHLRLSLLLQRKQQHSRDRRTTSRNVTSVPAAITPIRWLGSEIDRHVKFAKKYNWGVQNRSDLLLNAQRLRSNWKYRIPKSSISSLNPKQENVQSVLSHKINSDKDYDHLVHKWINWHEIWDMKLVEGQLYNLVVKKLLWYRRLHTIKANEHYKHIAECQICTDSNHCKYQTFKL